MNIGSFSPDIQQLIIQTEKSLGINPQVTLECCNLLEEKGKEYNCPLGLIGEPAPPPPHRYSRSKNVLKRHIRCSALGKTFKK